VPGASTTPSSTTAQTGQGTRRSRRGTGPIPRRGPQRTPRPTLSR
jgi:hypothetical protein